MPSLDTLREENMPEVYVASFCEEGDSLSQWRGYCPDGTGVAIGFHSSALQDPGSWTTRIEMQTSKRGYRVESGFYKCLYMKDEKQQIINDLADLYLQIDSKGDQKNYNNESFQTFLTLLGLCGPLFKHESFKDEKEWRLIVKCFSFDNPKRHFRKGRSTLVPYIKINILDKYKTNYVKTVTTGPTPEEGLADRAVKRLLLSRELEAATVEHSTVPYRSW